MLQVRDENVQQKTLYLPLSKLKSKIWQVFLKSENVRMRKEKFDFCHSIRHIASPFTRLQRGEKCCLQF